MNPFSLEDKKERMSHLLTMLNKHGTLKPSHMDELDSLMGELSIASSIEDLE